MEAGGSSSDSASVAGDISFNTSPKYKVKFTKMHGCGNDFVVFELDKVRQLSTNEYVRDWSVQQLSDLSKALANRKLGIGCDQVIIVNSKPNNTDTDYEMLIFNSDGEQATMCGNGVRCFSKYIIDNQIQSQTKNTSNEIQNIETLAGVIKTFPQLDHPLNTSNTTLIKVNMGNAMVLNTKQTVNAIARNEINLSTTDRSLYVYNIEIDHPTVNRLECVLVSMGNPHCVVFIERNQELGNISGGNYSGARLALMEIESIAMALQKHPLFADSCNVEFVTTASGKPNKVLSRVYERGSGETLACGTGACGVAVASILQGHCNADSEVFVEMPGGLLLISWKGHNQVFKTGPACTVFSSTIEL
ncbi:hypothetical protein CYY_008115 [Polysphondylium violaceum]|uniref:Diaminopimelate epimerase n=1 Tax=Polysphondylium violaceum TaxID=133409 RepID=A0A8J4PNS8_9MYCE|nr:hypothetical protein CYY_008115 [Polysphondylium violaceum]